MSDESWQYTSRLLDQMAEHGAWICVRALRDAGIVAQDDDALAEAIAELLRYKYGLRK